MSQFQLRLRRRNIPDEEILEDMRSVARVLECQTLTASQYDTNGTFGSTTALRRFGTWNKALQAAGILISNRQNIPTEELFENIANVWVSIGGQPFGRQMSEKMLGSEFSLGTYEKRFGSWNNALLAFIQFVENGNIGESVTNKYPTQCAAIVKRTTRSINWRLRAKILIRDNCICKMCGASPAKDSTVLLHVDHILAWDNGGETIEENLQTLCVPCNIGKSNMKLP